MVTTNRQLSSSQPMIPTTPQRGDMGHRSRLSPISAKALWTMAKYEGMTRGNELKAKYGYPIEVNETREKGGFEVKQEEEEPRGIMRRNESVSSGRHARFIDVSEKKNEENADFFPKISKLNFNDMEESRGKEMTEESFEKALKFMMKHRRQSFQFKNTDHGEVQSATKSRGNATLPPRIGGEELHEKEPTTEALDDKFNEAMIEPPSRGNGDFKRLGPDVRGDSPRGYSKGDFQVIHSAPRVAQNSEMIKIAALQKEMEKICGDRLRPNLKFENFQAQIARDNWKNKYEALMEKVKNLVKESGVG